MFENVLYIISEVLSSYFLMDYTTNATCLYKVELLEAKVTSKMNQIGPDEPITTKSQVIQSENTFGELYACMMPCLRTKLI